MERLPILNSPLTIVSYRAPSTFSGRLGRHCSSKVTRKEHEAGLHRLPRNKQQREAYLRRTEERKVLNDAECRKSLDNLVSTRELHDATQHDKHAGDGGAMISKMRFAFGAMMIRSSVVITHRLSHAPTFSFFLAEFPQDAFQNFRLTDLELFCARSDSVSFGLCRLSLKNLRGFVPQFQEVKPF